MKRYCLYFFGFIFMFLPLFGIFAQDYTVEVTVTDMWWNSYESFQVFLRADIYYNGELIEPSDDYYYIWYTDFSHDQRGWYVLTEGYGVYEINPDQIER